MNRILMLLLMTIAAYAEDLTSEQVRQCMIDHITIEDEGRGFFLLRDGSYDNIGMIFSEIDRGVYSDIQKRYALNAVKQIIRRLRMEIDEGVKYVTWREKSHEDELRKWWDDNKGKDKEMALMNLPEILGIVRHE